jgi:hypothetical protein
MKKKLSCFLCIAITLSILLLNVNAYADSMMDKFIDPKDGKFDCGDWFLNHKGFLLVPEVITEPAVGYGGGAFLLFFHDSLAAKMSREKIEEQENKSGSSTIQMIPPSISGAGAFKTENGTWGGAGFHFGSWQEDHIRYLGAAGKVSLNLTFYGTSEDSPLKNGVDYNLEGWGVFQELKFRMGDSNAFFGGKLSYFDSTSTFEFGQNSFEIEEWELDLRNVGAGFVVDYDSRDNMFTPNTGVNTKLTAMFYSTEGALDISREYQVVDGRNKAYWKIGSLPLVLGWRVSGRLSTGRVPFYALPYIELRGIPLSRYQGNHALETEVEARYQVTDRWGLIGFGGVGRTSKNLNEFAESENRWAGGVGFRYLIARVLKLHTGVDVAKGPEDWAIYFKVGSGL